MNHIQKNPNDLQYSEFHNGEYEFWPIASAIKKKSISFPAAVVSGLELIAAAAAAGLLALAVSAMYITSAPRNIDVYSAVINANVYNNSSDNAVSYILYLEDEPDQIHHQGVLEDSENTMYFQNLNSGSTYILKYFDEDQNEVSEFRFTTLGDPSPSSQPQPPVEPEQPQNPQPPQDPQNPQDPAENPDPPEEEEPGEEAEVEEPEDEEDPEGNDTPPAPVQPTPNVPRPDPTPNPGPDTPDPEPDIPDPEPDTPDPEPEVVVDKAVFAYVESESGLEFCHFIDAPTYTFPNIPEGYEIEVRQNGEVVEFDLEDNGSGTLKITPYEREVYVGTKVETVVTVRYGDQTIESVSKLAPPMLDKENIAVTITQSGANSYDVTATTKVLPDDADDMTCWAVVEIGGQTIEIPMTKAASDTYSGSKTVTNVFGSGTAFVEIHGSYSAEIEGVNQVVYVDMATTEAAYGS